jgi:chromate transporter
MAVATLNADVLQLSGHLALLSLIAIGGIMPVLPDIQRYVVDEHAWMTGGDFAAMVAIGQAAPGPNFLLVTLIGYQVAGLSGALAATAAMCLPSSAVTYLVTRVSHRIGDAPWKRIVQRGLAALTVGLVLAGGYVLAVSAGSGIAGYVISAVAVAVSVATRLNPIWVLALAAVVGAVAL